MPAPNGYSRSARAFESAAGLVSELSWLVSPPEVCLRVSELLESENSSARDFEKVIGQDPNLTARLLKLVNSSFFGLSARIDTIGRAVTIIGLRELKQLQEENRRLKRVVADLTLDKDILQEALRKKW